MSTRSIRHSSRIAANNHKKNYDSEDSIQSTESRMSLRSSTRRGTTFDVHDNESNRKSSTASSVHTPINNNNRRRSGKSKREDIGSDMDTDVNSSTSSLKRRDSKRGNSNKRSRVNSYDSTSTVYDSSVQMDESKQGTEDTLNSSSTATEKKKNSFGKKKREYVGDPPLNLNDYEKPFKNPNYTTPRKYKLLKQILLMDRNRTDIPIDAPLYLNIEAPPSVYPRKKYCDITGLKSIYTDPKTGLRYYDSNVYKYIQEQPQGTLQGYLGLRNAAVNLI